MQIDYSRLGVKSVLLSLWQLPQVIAALVLLLFFRNCSKSKLYHGSIDLTVNVVRTGNRTWGLSLGTFVFVPTNSSIDCLKHETGHSFQSLYLGPSYLVFVGIPSVTLFIIKRICKKDNVWYHTKYPEVWANKISKAYQYRSITVGEILHQNSTKNEK